MIKHFCLWNKLLKYRPLQTLVLYMLLPPHTWVYSVTHSCLIETYRDIEIQESLEKHSVIKAVNILLTVTQYLSEKRTVLIRVPFLHFWRARLKSNVWRARLDLSLRK